MIDENTGIRIETTLGASTRAWEITPSALQDQGLLDIEMQPLNDYLRWFDLGLDGNGSFVAQAHQALCNVLDTGARKSLVVAYSEYDEITIDVRPQVG